MDKIAPANRKEFGPYDSSEVALPQVNVDFGSIVVLPTEDVAVRVEVEEATGKPVMVTLEKANSLLQVLAFAAPNSEGLWSEVMDQLRTSISAAGGSVSDATSTLGPCLLAEIPQADSAPRKVKFIGVDGPRWFLRGTVSGAALVDQSASDLIDDLFRTLIVRRGESPMPPRETLPLQLPEGAIAPPRTVF